MQNLREVSILGCRGIITEAVKRFLEEELAFPCKILAEPDISLSGKREGTDLIVVMPEEYRQLSRWLPVLQKVSPACPWLLVAEYRMAGMFVTSLQRHPCFLLSAHPTLEENQEAIELLIEGYAPPPFAQLQARFMSQANVSSGRNLAAFLTPKEFEVGCAVSLGLTNTQIAKALFIQKATVVSHLNHMYHKLRLTHRQELAAYFDQALSSEPAVPF